jgi:orotidine-5'-phosphate decarboxylase
MSVIIALDVESGAGAIRLVDRLGDSASFYKVGLELYAAAGMDFVRELQARGKDVFLDLKLLDIGETVKRAVARVSQAGVRFLTVHASVPAMRAAVEGRAGAPLRLLGVTVLTSYDQSDLAADGIQMPLADLVTLRVKNARECGMDGVVCSPLEIRTVRTVAGPHLLLVTPGVRSAGSAAGDQKRVATPAEAMAWGADHLVIGRQVTRAADPAAELARILDEIQASRATA